MLKKLHKGKFSTDIELEPNEGERTLLCSNKGGLRSPSLDLGIHPDSTEDQLINILTDILAEGFLWHHKYGKEHKTKSGHILPGINKRTG